MLTVEDARAYLLSIGITLPEFLLEILVDQVNTIDACLIANYPESTGRLIGLYTLGLLGLSNGDKYISSQTAPSGASQSFKYRSLGDAWNSIYGMLSRLDTAGCATPLLPANPTQGAFAGIWTAKGGCNCG